MRKDRDPDDAPSARGLRRRALDEPLQSDVADFELDYQALRAAYQNARFTHRTLAEAAGLSEVLTEVKWKAIRDREVIGYHYFEKILTAINVRRGRSQQVLLTPRDLARRRQDIPHVAFPTPHLLYRYGDRYHRLCTTDAALVSRGDLLPRGYWRLFWELQRDQFFSWRRGDIPISEFEYFVHTRHAEFKDNENIPAPSEGQRPATEYTFRFGWRLAQKHFPDREFLDFFRLVFAGQRTEAFQKYSAPAA